MSNLKEEAKFHLVFKMDFPPIQEMDKPKWLSEKFFDACFMEIKSNIIHQFVHEYSADDYPEYIPKFYKLSAKLESDYSPQELNKSIDTIKEDAYRFGYEIGFNTGNPKWIDIEDELPLNKKIVLVFNQEYEMAVCKFERTEWEYFFMLFNTNHQILDVTHWMPLPDPPK